MRFNFNIQILYVYKILKKAVNKRRKNKQDIIILKKSLKSGTKSSSEESSPTCGEGAKTDHPPPNAITTTNLSLFKKMERGGAGGSPLQGQTIDPRGFNNPTPP